MNVREVYPQATAWSHDSPLAVCDGMGWDVRGRARQTYRSGEHTADSSIRFKRASGSRRDGTMAVLLYGAVKHETLGSCTVIRHSGPIINPNPFLSNTRQGR